ncbi:hypothetical protein C7293_04140 [filamentous cyanobacterium CCT1]|nr:hypothetical protein C7293_04140 [filamentous cyanobacterium CCT1]PSN80215.1 hypothetical protein C8B47_07655 [filamentous cyanobacterium CCP4]
MTQQRWPVVLGSAIAVLASAHPAYEALLEPSPMAERTIMAMIMPPSPNPLKPKGSRGDEVYAIAPSDIEGLNVIWRDGPLLIWEGAIARVEVTDAETEELLWSQSVSPEDRWVAYGGAPLQPGHSYEWMLCDGSNAVAHLVSFQVLAAEKRDRITSALAEQAAALQSEKASPEEMALARAICFAEQGLWSDVLMEAFSVQEPSADLVKLLLALLPKN